MTDDRRDSPRVTMRAQVRVLSPSPYSEWVDGDLSLGGFAWTGALRDPGTPVELTLPVSPSGQNIVLKGEVMHAAPIGTSRAQMRARFLEDSVDVELALARHLQRAVMGA